MPIFSVLLYRGVFPKQTYHCWQPPTSTLFLDCKWFHINRDLHVFVHNWLGQEKNNCRAWLIYQSINTEGYLFWCPNDVYVFYFIPFVNKVEPNICQHWTSHNKHSQTYSESSVISAKQSNLPSSRISILTFHPHNITVLNQ